MSLDDARYLKQDFPEETEGFDVFQVEKIWQAYSYSLEAGWIIPDAENVARVFSAYWMLKP